ncbi:ABC transporter ATP-binding protein [Gorillibacterium timonense]|uniref:ABC transporter ATP-binding protein n=1 Tax=Gorillibacterium timonense TaxID=1689269 RepID=UPI00071DB19A|nr:ABC transporter ATP-binding protein [Gorillibacterium timonense]
MSKNKADSSVRTLRTFLSSIEGYRTFLMVCTAFSFPVMALNLSEAFFIEKMTDVSLDSKWDDLYRLIALMLGVVVAGVLLTFFQKVVSGYYSSRTLYRFRMNVLRKVQRLPVSVLKDQHTGDVLSRMTEDIKLVEHFIGNQLVNILFQAVMFLGVFVYTSTLHFKLILVSVFVPVIVAAVVNVLSKDVRHSTRKEQEHLGRASSVLQDMLGGMLLVKAYRLTGRLHQKYSSELDAALRYNMRITRFVSYTTPLHTLLYAAPFLICISYGGILTIQGALSPGELLAIVVLLDYMTGPLAGAPEMIIAVQRMLGASDRLLELINLDPERSSGLEPTIQSDQPVVEFHNVSFSYGGQKPVLQGISFQLRKGEKIGLAGYSGSGKSTILKLICGFYPPEQGNVNVYGTDVNQWWLEKLRSEIAVINQDCYLFPVTIGENISYGRLGASQTEIEKAAGMADLQETIDEFQDGYDTLVQERGMRLSGGQRQRLALARAILKQADLVLLDEPTSALDLQTEKSVQQAMESALRGKTVLTIAHRLSTIQDCDRILVLDEGRIVEAGTHQELMSLDGVYRRLYLKQSMMDSAIAN